MQQQLKKKLEMQQKRQQKLQIKTQLAKTNRKGQGSTANYNAHRAEQRSKAAGGKVTPSIAHPPGGEESLTLNAPAVDDNYDAPRTTAVSHGSNSTSVGAMPP